MSTRNRRTPRSDRASTENIRPEARQDTLLAEASMSRYQALRAINFIAVSDYVIAALIAFTLVTLFFWNLFGDPTLVNVIVCFMVILGLAQIWAITLMYRCAHFVITLQTTVSLLPEQSARIALAALQGGGSLGKE